MKYQEVYRMAKQAMVKEALGLALTKAVGKGARNMFQGPAPAPYGAENGQAVPRGASKAQLQQMADYNKSVTPYRAAGAAIKDFAGTIGKGLSQILLGVPPDFWQTLSDRG